MNVFTKQMSFAQFIKYLLPSVLTMVFLSFYTTIDGFFVSRYAGANALAGINIVIPLTCVVFGVSVMLATGSGAIIGEHMGRGEIKKANEIFSMVSIVLLGFSIIFTVVGIVFLKPIAAWLGASEALMEHVLPYALVTFLGTLPMAFKLFFEYMVRTDGNPKVCFAMSFLGIVLNVLFDYIAVGILRLGTFGAALGTIASISVSAIIGVVYFLKYSTIRFERPVFDRAVFWKCCTNGSSEMLTEFSTGITTFLFNIIIIRSFGEDGVAAVTIIMYIYYFFIAFYMGIAVASAPVISYNLGAGNKKKIKETVRYSFITIAITAIMILTTLYVGGEFIVSLFADSGYVHDLTMEALAIFSPEFIFIGVNVFLSSYFTAVGDGLTSAIISTLRSLIFVIIYIFTLPQIVGIHGVWMTMPFAEITTIFIAIYFYFKKGRPIMREK